MKLAFGPVFLLECPAQLRPHDGIVVDLSVPGRVLYV